MTSYEKVVKGACKPKAAPPKAKYLDPIIAATWDEGGAIHDVCKALSPRFREPIDPFLLVLAGCTVEAALRRAGVRRSRA